MRVGQSNVIGALLLIVVVVSGWALIYLSALGKLGFVSSEARRSVLETELTLAERIVIEHVVFTPGRIGVYVTNIGDKDVVVSSLYVNSSLVGMYNTPLLVGEGTWVNASFSPVSGALYRVRVCTSISTCAEVMAVAP